MKYIIKRLRAETPRFFRKIIYLCMSCASLSGGILLAQQTFPEWKCPGWLNKAAQQGITISVVAGAVAKLTVKDPTVLSEEDKK